MAIVSLFGSLLASMNGRKSAYDNAVAESFFSNLKNELIHHSDLLARDHTKSAIFDYIELSYVRGLKGSG
jgi:putative transposase